MEELRRLLDLLPPKFRVTLERQRNLHELVEIILDLGRQPIARFPESYVVLSDTSVTEQDLLFAVSQVSEFGDDNRAGIDRTLHRISALRNRDGKIFGLTMRVGRSIPGSANLAADLLKAGCSILLLGRPGVGKSTSLRDCARILAEDCKKRVIIVDTSNEIGGDGDIPHPSIAGARRMQVPRTEEQHRVMIEAVENHMPEVIIIDEIGTAAEAAAARTIAQRGVQLVATAHGSELENLIKNPTLSELVGGIESVTLGDEEARRRGVQKSILERMFPPTFDVAVEMVDREQWRVHCNVAEAVDRLLTGQDAEDELRTFDDAGRVRIVQDPDNMPVSSIQSPERPWKLPQNFVPPDEPVRARQPAAQLPANAPAADIRGSQNPMQPSAPPDNALHIYPAGIERQEVQEVIASLNLEQSLWLTDRVHDADAILALRSHVKQGDWVRTVAKAEGIPVYALKAAGKSNLIRGLRTLTGVDPSAGALFDQRDGGRSDSSSIVSRAVAENEADALQEARLAVEEIVLPRQQPIELLPRSPAVLELQVELIGQYGLGHEVVGAANNARLRILPANAHI